MSIDRKACDKFCIDQDVFGTSYGLTFRGADQAGTRLGGACSIISSLVLYMYVGI